MARRRQEDSEEESEEDERSSDASSGDEESSSASGSESSGEEEDEDEEEEADEDEDSQKATAKYNLVEADLVEIKKMVEDMDRIKMRLQFRLAREATSSAHSSLHRRSSVEDIYVPPPTVSASVQTTWDMPRMFEVEKIVSSSEDRSSKPVQVDPDSAIPVNKSVQLSLEDLARSYGIQDALGDKGSAYCPPSPGKINVQVSATRQDQGSPSAPPSTLQSHMWDNLIIGGGDADRTKGSEASEDPPPQLNRLQLVSGGLDHHGFSSQAQSFAHPQQSPLEDSFGIPTSPTKSDTTQAIDATHSSQRRSSDQAKTVEQKEMEAMKSLLFF